MFPGDTKQHAVLALCGASWLQKRSKQLKKERNPIVIEGKFGLHRFGRGQLFCFCTDFLLDIELNQNCPDLYQTVF